MYKIYNTNTTTKITAEISEFIKGSWINLVNPTEDEINIICENTGVDKQHIRHCLDYEERARIDIEDDGIILCIIDVPIIEEETEIHTTMPLGIIIVENFFITVSLKPNNVIKHLEKNKSTIETYKKSRTTFQILYVNASIFLKYLKEINKEIEVTEQQLKNSMKNKELLKMLSLEKSLLYFTTSLKSNEVVMERILRGKRLTLYEEDEDLLEDAITENKQAIEMSQIYSGILSNTMDAYASIISNNLNIVMKFLASITIILAIPNLIAGIWGMNVPVPFQNNINGFVILLVFSILITIFAILWLRKRELL